MARFRDIKTLQKFASVHASIYNHGSSTNATSTAALIFEHGRAAALAEWCQLAS